MNKPVFSIIMPVYNRESFLAKSIESVLNQLFPYFELLCINDGSTDESLNILNTYASKDNRVRVLDLGENKGRSYARNFGLDNARADWICFLDSDDVFLENHLSSLNHLIGNKSVFYAYATEQTIDGEKKIYLNRQLYDNEVVITFKDVIKANPLQLNQLTFHNSLLVRFDSIRMPIFEDLYFFRMLLLKTDIFKKDIVTSIIQNHEQRSVKTIELKKQAEWLCISSKLFIDTADISWNKKSSIMSHTYLLASNILLSKGIKKEAFKYIKKALNYIQTYYSILLLKSIVKIILK